MSVNTSEGKTSGAGVTRTVRGPAGAVVAIVV
jgi:hypothetical protein